MAKKATAATAEDKKTREAQTAAYKAASWRRVLRLNSKGGGAFRMERGN